MKLQSILVKHFCKYFAVKIIHIEDPDLTFKVPHILDHLMCLGLMDCKFVLIHAKLFYQLHKGIDRKSIMLHGNTEFFSGLFFGDIFGFHQFVLFYYLPCIPQEFFTRRCHGNSTVCSSEDLNPGFCLQFPDRRGKTWLGNIKAFGCLVHRSGFCNCYGISELCQSHLFASLYFISGGHF